LPSSIAPAAKEVKPYGDPGRYAAVPCDCRFRVSYKLSMSESRSIASILKPNTRESLREELHAAGVRAEMVLLVHSSLSRLGWVSGGPVAVIQALQDILTPDGTLVMPAHSSDYSEPSYWQAPPVPPEWWESIRASMPAFDPRLTPSRNMGAIAELFRTWPGVVRSHHPALSFAAWGKEKEMVTAKHELDFGCGEGSPLARIYELGGHVLLLGVDHLSNTSLHLAESRSGKRKEMSQGAPVLEGGRRVWREYRDWDFDCDEFPALGRAFAEAGGDVTKGRVGAADTLLFPQAPLVDFALERMTKPREILEGPTG
jgi:aminoglycoside 3-N-acetyltransferase